jgi:hypothetical protein
MAPIQIEVEENIGELLGDSPEEIKRHALENDRARTVQAQGALCWSRG